MDAMDQSDFRAEGFAVMVNRLMGCMAAQHTPNEPAQRIAFLEGMLASLDNTRASIVEEIDRCGRAIERAADEV